MAFFYKHIVPTGLKSVSTNQVTRTKRRTSGKQYFTKSYLAQLVTLTCKFAILKMLILSLLLHRSQLPQRQNQRGFGNVFCSQCSQRVHGSCRYQSVPNVL